VAFLTLFPEGSDGYDKTVKVVFQKDAKGSAQRWVEITVDEFTITDEQPIPPPARKESRPRPAATKN
jgi:hypothetical protein